VSTKRAMSCHISTQIACVVLWISALIRGQWSLAFYITKILKLKRHCCVSSCARHERAAEARAPLIDYAYGVVKEHCRQYRTYCTDHQLSIKLFNNNPHVAFPLLIILHFIPLWIRIQNLAAPFCALAGRYNYSQKREKHFVTFSSFPITTLHPFDMILTSNVRQKHFILLRIAYCYVLCFLIPTASHTKIKAFNNWHRVSM